MFSRNIRREDKGNLSSVIRAFCTRPLGKIGCGPLTLASQFSCDAVYFRTEGIQEIELQQPRPINGRHLPLSDFSSNPSKFWKIFPQQVVTLELKKQQQEKWRMRHHPESTLDGLGPTVLLGDGIAPLVLLAGGFVLPVLLDAGLSIGVFNSNPFILHVPI